MGFEYYFFAAIILFVGLCLWTLVEILKSSKWLLFLIIPMILGISTSGWFTYKAIIGYPTTHTMDGEVMVLATAVYEPKFIWFWVQEPGVLRPRVYEIPYTKEAHDAADEMAERSKNGGKTMMKRREHGTDEGEAHSGATNSFGEFIFYDFPHQKFYPKN